MEKVNILLAWPLDAECQRMIQDVSPSINLLDASSLVQAEQKGDHEAAYKLDQMLQDTEIVIWFFPFPNVQARSPRLKWAHAMLAGVDHPEYNSLKQSPLLLTNTHIHGIQISELVFAFILMLAKKAPHCFDMKSGKRAERFVPMVIHGKTLGIVGLGNIGREVARLGKAFGMRVVANRWSARGRRRVKNVDLMLSKEELPQLLGESDFVVLAVPLTGETMHLIGEKELRCMKSTAYLINIARGSVVDEPVLIRALEEKWIAGAGLDVYESFPQPLPPHSKLWDLPEVVLTPHISGVREDYALLATRQFCKNLRRYLEGVKLLNLVDKQKGY
jgi:D-2-hydroxyacid dehydrogenase (NADP+)